MMSEATLYFDGGIRQGVMALGFVLSDIDNNEILTGNGLCGKNGSSNISEYKALIAGLQGSLETGIDIIHICGDSQLVVKQITGVFKTKNSKLKKLRNYVLELLEHFEGYTIKWIPRNDNQRADALVNDAFKEKSDE